MTIADQPDPVPNGRSDVWATIIAEMQERRRIGINRYGTPLQPFNGRNANVDLIQELLDALAYAMQDELERQEPSKGLRAVLGDMVRHVREFDLPHPGVVGFDEDLDKWGDRILKAAGFFRLQEQLRQRDQQMALCFTREALIAVLETMNHGYWAEIQRDVPGGVWTRERWHEFVEREVDGWFELVRRGLVPGVPVESAADAGQQR